MAGPAPPDRIWIRYSEHGILVRMRRLIPDAYAIS